jgi:REP element-mobilizing transposase RayT
MRTPRQLNLLAQIPRHGPKRRRPELSFGGIYFKNYNPSMQRPMDSKKALHVTLKSSRAIGEKSFKNKIFERKIYELVASKAQDCSIKIYGYANGGNHLHILMRAKRREDYQRFIRTITGLIARFVGGAERGKKLKNKFWDNRPFSRVVSFAKSEFYIVRRYLTRNVLEAIGWMPYVQRSKKLNHYWSTFLSTTFIV